MSTVLLVLVAIGVTIYAVIDCLSSDDGEIRSLPKPLWLLVILGTPPVGGVLWILLGRLPASGAPRSRRLRTIGPDDDPDFLRSLSPPRRRGERRKPDTEDDDGDSGPA